MAHVSPCSAILVDDDPNMHGLVRAIFRSIVAGDVECVANGVEALPMLLDRDWDVVMLDLALPGLDGFSLIETLEARRPELLSRVVVISALSKPKTEAIRPRVFRILEKPFEVQVLADLCMECAGKSRVISSQQ